MQQEGQEDERRCLWYRCDAELIRRGNESPAKFAKRDFCCPACGASHAHAQKQERNVRVAGPAILKSIVPVPDVSPLAEDPYYRERMLRGALRD